MTEAGRPNKVSEQLSDAIADLQRNGFEVVREPAIRQLPDSLRQFRLDALARRGEEVVVLELLTKGEAREAQLQELADVVSRERGWRLELLWAGDDAPPIPQESSVATWLERASEVAPVSIEAAILSLWVGVEDALERLGVREGITQGRGPSSRLIAELYSRGVLSDRQFKLLVDTRDIRNSLTHGVSIFAAPQLSVQEVIELASWVADDDFVSTDRMVEDFLNQYEDPAHNVPYDSGEGGYQYIGNGPFDAYEVLAEKYETAPQDDLEEAADRLNSESTEWVLKEY